jgi:hypothetical protein
VTIIGGRSVAFTVADYILKRLSDCSACPWPIAFPLSDAAPNRGIKSVVAASDHPHDLPAELP